METVKELAVRSTFAGSGVNVECKVCWPLGLIWAVEEEIVDVFVGRGRDGGVRGFEKHWQEGTGWGWGGWGGICWTCF